MKPEQEQELLRSVALQNVRSVLLARQQAEEDLLLARDELRLSRERLQAALSAADTGTFRWDLRNNAIDCDANTERLFGLVPVEGPRSLDDFIAAVHPSDRPAVRDACERCLRDGVDFEMEFRALWRDGSVHWIAGKGKAACDEHGKPVSMTGACIEITRLKRADEAMREVAQRLQLALAAGQLGDWSWEAATDLVTLGERAASIFGLTANSSITFAQMSELAREDHRERARLAIKDALANRTDYDVEYAVRLPSGESRWIAARGRGTYAPDGSVLGMIGVVQDVTARKQADEALRQREALLRATFEQAAVGIVRAQLDGSLIETNQKLAEILGYERDELTPLSALDITHPDDVERSKTLMGRLLAGELSDSSIEKRYVRKDGTTIWGLATITLIRDAKGQPLHFVAVIEDITRRRQTEEALRQSEQFNRTIIESSRDCIETLSPEGVVLWISESGCRALHVEDTSSIIGTRWVDMWQKEDQDSARAAVARAAQGGTGSFVGCMPVAGKPRFWNVVITPILGSSGEAATLLAVSRDVTVRIEIESALREETRVLELLNVTGTRLASQLDIQALLQTVTDAATELSGAKFGAFFYDTEDDGGEARLFTLSGMPREAFEGLRRPGATPLFHPTFSGEGAVRCDDVLEDPRYRLAAPHHGVPPGQPPVRSYLAVPVITRSGKVIGGLFCGHPEVGIFSERTERIVAAVAAQAAIAIDNARLYEAAQTASEERRQLLESERHARSHAERMSATKDEFLAILSHELRTPLSAILGWSHILRRRVSDGDVIKGLEVIERNARVQTQLIEDLLDMSRITSGKMRLDVQPVVPFAFIEAAIETVRPAAAAKGVRLEVLLDPAAGPISGDAGRLQQVVWNLLSNAIKFTPRDGRVQVLLQRVDSHVEISVADTGAGIRPEFLEHVFERFRQADSSTTRKHGGLGLGLAIVKRLVELHGGTVEAYSPGEGCGTTFIVKLPLSVVHHYDERGNRVHPSAPPISAIDFQVQDLSSVRVLVVDDEPDARNLVARVLGECGATVLCAGSAEEALSMIERERPAVMISDIGMPGVDGFELLRRVRNLGDAGRLPVIALTAFARWEDRTRALSAGFLVHVSKPIEPSELVATVAAVASRTGQLG